MSSITWVIIGALSLREVGDGLQSAGDLAEGGDEVCKEFELHE